MISEQKITRNYALDVIYQQYHDEVCNLCMKAKKLVEDGKITNKTQLQSWFHKSIENSSWVKYTYQNLQVLLCSDNFNAYVDKFGTEGLVKNGTMNWSRLAYMAMMTDVEESMPAWRDLQKPAEKL